LGGKFRLIETHPKTPLNKPPQAEVGKVTLKGNGNEALSDESLLKSTGDEALNDDFP
jgi:hypothetical protein